MMNKKNIIVKVNNVNPIKVLYKKVGQAPEVKIISSIFKLKKTIVNKKLDIIPYQNVYIICHSKRTRKNMPINVIFDMFNIAGDMIIIQINRPKREFESLSKESIEWFTKDLIDKSNILEKTKEQRYIKDFSKLFEKQIRSMILENKKKAGN